MRLNHNVYSLSIYNSYRNSLAKGNDAMNKLSSGLKIGAAKDNASKISHNEKLKISIVSTSAASKNSQDMSSMMQSIDGDMQQMNNILCRLKELAVQGNNATVNDEKQTIQNEINVLTEELDYIARNSQFNGKKLINDDIGPIKGSMGPNDSDEINIPTFNLRFDTLFPNGIDLITDFDTAQNALTDIDAAIDRVSNVRGEYGAIQVILDEKKDSLDAINESLSKAQSLLGDADLAEEMIKYTSNSIIAQAATALMVQSNRLPQDALAALANVK